MIEARHILQDEFGVRRGLNPSYSLRAFARDLGVSPQQLSNVMNGRRGLGPELAERVAMKLELSPEKREMFLESLRARFSRSRIQRIVSESRLQSLRPTAETRELELDYFKTISNWYHFALIELVKLRKNKPQTVTWFSRRLGISENEVDVALMRLERLGLVTKSQAGWHVNQDVVTFDYGRINDAVRKFHHQVLEKAIVAMSSQTSEQRYGSSSTIPIKVSSLPLARQLIQEFRTEFNKAVTAPEDGEEVYGLSLQFFRLTEESVEEAN